MEYYTKNPVYGFKAPKSTIEWENLAKELIFNGVFLVGGGIAIYIVAKLFFN
jgi:hypothetical protein